MSEPNADGAVKEPGAGHEPATPETPDQRNADEGDKGKLIASLQEKAARVNAAEAETQRLKAQLDALTRAPSPAAHGSDPRAERQKMVRDFAEGRIGDGVDPVAAELIETQQRLDMALQEITNMRELDRIADEDKRAKVTEHFNANRHRLGDVKAARAEIEREEQASKLREQEQELERLRKTLELQSQRVNAVPTHTREVTAAEHKDVMTQAQWNERQAALERAADDGNLEAARIRRREQVQRANGTIRIED